MRKLTLSIYPASVMRVIAVFIGFIYVTIVYKKPELLHLTHDVFQPIRDLAVTFIVLFPLSLILSACSDKESGKIYFFVVIGIVVGVMIDAVSDKVDRNLFPIEIIAFVVLATPGTAAGVAVGSYLNKRFRSKSH